MPPAARVTDPHVCPAVTGVVPHVGGPILPPGAPTVLINGLPAARQTDMVTCAGPPSNILVGSTGVLIGGLPAARLGDPTSHGGTVAFGSPNVIIGEVGAASPGSAGFVAVATGAAMAISPADRAIASLTCKEKMERAIANAPLAKGVLDALGGPKGIATGIVAAGVIQAIPVAGEVEDITASLAVLGLALSGFQIGAGLRELYEFGKQICAARSENELHQSMCDVC